MPGLKRPHLSTSITMGTIRGANWSITINNPTDDDYAEIEALKIQPWFKSWEGQLEHPEGGTLHIQARLQTETVRWGKVKTALTRAHVEKAQNVLALTNYVHKKDTKVAELPSRVSKWMNIQQFYPILAAGVVDRIAVGESMDTQDVRQVFTRRLFRDNEETLKKWKGKYDGSKLATEIALEQIERGAMGLEYIITNPATKTMIKTCFWSLVERSLNS